MLTSTTIHYGSASHPMLDFQLPTAELTIEVPSEGRVDHGISIAKIIETLTDANV